MNSVCAGYGQLGAVLGKNFIEKRRSIRVTCCECCSHLIIILLLMYGFGLSKVLYLEDETYSVLKLKVPEDLLLIYAAQDPSNNIRGTPTRRPTRMPLEVGQTRAPTIRPTSLPTLINKPQSDLFTVLTDFMEGPLPIFTFDQFITANNYISNAARGLGNNVLVSTSSLGRQYANLYRRGTIHFAPSGDAVYNLVNYLNDTTTTFRTVRRRVHDSEEAAVDYILNYPGERALALIVIRSATPSNVDYVIRQNYSTLPNTNEIVDVFSLGLNAEYQKYYTSGFLTLQRTVNEWAFEYTNTSKANDRTEGCRPPNVFTMPMPTAAYDQNPFYGSVGFLLGLALTMATLYPMSRLVKSVVEEKESKMREVMKIMGLRDWVHQLSWFLTAFIVFFWIAISTLYLVSNSFLSHSSTFLLFWYFFWFAMSEITLSFLVAVFFSNSKLAAIVGPVVLFVFIIPRFIFLSTNSYEETTAKLGSSILSPTAFSLGADIIASYEQVGVGVQFSNMNEGDYSFSTVIAFLFVDTLLYAALAWYFGQILPSEYGTPQKPWFIFMYKYWFPTAGNSGYQRLSNEAMRNELAEISLAHANENVEMLTDEQKARVQVVIHRLQKRYDDGKLAVKSLDLAMVEGEITCLLGHNGAGKSTTISVLTGLHVPTGGECSIFGRNLSTELPAIRRMTGICPQQNVLFPTLTVTEHLRFFGVLKGLRGKELRDAVSFTLTNVGLTEKAYAASSALSGGMKRKLCLAMALIGDPTFVLLDEPTSGMDPYSRRSTWELVQRSKAGKVIVLTTHFMDEADILGDRIAIMSEGRLRCSGSSLFLKNRFGVGYILTMAKAEQNCSVPAVTNMVLSHVPDAKLQSAVAGEMVYQMPVTAVRSFASLFTSIKDQGPLLGVGAYGISITTLEQVFIRLAQEINANAIDEDDFVPPSHLSKALDAIFYRVRLVYRWLKNRIYPDENALEPPNTKLLVSVVSPTAIVETKDDVSPSYTPGKDVELPPPRRNTWTPNALELQTSTSQEEKAVVEVVPSYDIIEAQHQGVVRNDGGETTPQGNENTLATVPVGDVEGEGNALATTEADQLTQLVELIKKRYVIARRDVKGLFYQVLFPALQILLVLLILTIDLNPAGKSIVLDSTIFPSGQEVIYAGNRTGLTGVRNIPDMTPMPRLFPYPDGTEPFSRYSLLLHHSRLNECSNNVYTPCVLPVFRRFLLRNILKHDKKRYGAYYFRDLIYVNLTVDWVLTKPVLSVFFPQITELNDNFVQLNVSGILRRQQDVNGVKNSIAGLLNVSTTGDPVLAIEKAFKVNITSPALRRAIRQINQALNTSSVTTPSATTFLPQYVDLPIEVGSGASIEIRVGPINYYGKDIYQFLNLEGTQIYLAKLPNTYSVVHNSTSAHGVAAFTGALAESAYKECSPAADATFTARNHPLPLTALQTIEIKIILAIFASLFILIPLCYIPASFVTFVVKERATKSKHLQIVSSVSPYLYWTATYLWDMLLYTILTLCVLCAFYIYGINASQIFVGSTENAGAVFLLVFLFGSSCIPLSYLYSFAFDNHATAQISIMTINFFTGFVFVLAYFVMSSIPQTAHAAEQAVEFFRLFPPYNVGEGLINLSATYYRIYAGGKQVSYFDYDSAGRNIIYLSGETVVFCLLVLFSESEFAKDIGYKLQNIRARMAGAPPRPKMEEDVDVTTERNKVRDIDPKEYALLVRDLVKTYPPSILGGNAKFAVRGVSLGCPVGETFGLLGINGAGKTTTLGILTGDFRQTTGEAYIAGMPLSNPKTRKMVGFCPQVDPLLDLMTGYETLWFFGSIRGMPPEVLQPKIDKLVRDVGLIKHAHRPCGTYSGGNKRKLSLAVALIGDPKVLFLDEPSTGMDPEARRHMWSVIAEVARERSVVLTTHSMEECEALCTRVGIMVSGRMQCLGSIQHLKGRFGASYEIEVRCEQRHVDVAVQSCSANIPGVVVEETHGSFFRLKAYQGLDLATTFGFLETNKESLGIIEYSVSQATLEQIFIQFAKDQEEETIEVRSLAPATQNQNHPSELGSNGRV